MGIKIAFTGWAGSGKTEAARYLAHKFDGEVLSFAEGVKYVYSYVFNNNVKDRLTLQKIGQFFRSLKQTVWIDRTLETAKYEDIVFIDDLRQRDEYDALVKEGFTIIRIVADEDIRVKRLIERDGQCDTSIMYNSSENGCADLQLIEIENNGTIEEFYQKLDELMREYK